MTEMQVKRHRNNYEVNLFFSRNSKAHYHNLIDKDANKLAQIFLDLKMEGFPIEEAFHIMQRRIKNKDWLGF